MLAGFDLAIQRSRLALLGLLAAGLAGCGGVSLLGESGPPPRVYEISPKSTFEEGLPRVPWQLVVEEPHASSAVNTDRIAARTGAFEFLYYKGVRWSDRAPKMVQTLLVESFENSGRITAVGRQAIGLRSDYKLMSDLREFQVHLPPKGAAPLVWVRMNFKLVEQPSAQIVGFTTLGRQAQAADGSMAAIVRAFDDALGAVMKDAVAWTLQTGQKHYTPDGLRRLSESE